MLKLKTTLAAAFLALSIGGLFFVVSRFRLWPEAEVSRPPPAWPPPATELSPEETALTLRKQRERLDRTLWTNEVRAQKYEETIVKLWDDLLGPKDKFTVLGDFSFSELAWGAWEKTLPHAWEIREHVMQGRGRALNPAHWKEFLAQKKEEGYRIESTEWHQAKFDVDPDGSARSVFAFVLYVKQPAQSRKLLLKGDLEIRWTTNQDAGGRFLAGALHVPALRVLEWRGPAVFEEVKLLDESDMLRSPFGVGLEPVLAYDLNGDGLSDLLVGGCNLILWNRGEGDFEKSRLEVPDPQMPTDAAVIADFTGDGLPDLVSWQWKGELMLYPGLPGGGFAYDRATRVYTFNESLRMPLAFAAGDVDGDGRVDLWVSQYKMAYEWGQFPTPYYDANDGFPSYLLLNKGDGRFEDATASAGLAPKRFRRTFSSSFLDLDGDGHLDLLVVNDYSGVDVYLNDGHGHFTDATEKMLDERSIFGMSHALADYNLDGRLDLFVTGMSSTTARRLEYMKLGRDDMPEHTRMRMRLGYGNRMYLAQPGNTFKQPGFKDRVARTGWSWGSTAIDFDNDGDPDIYVANGHITGKSTKDHCTQFWRHDIYTGSSKHDSGIQSVFRADMEELRKSVSWDGYQHNVLLMNESGQDFLNVAFLFDVDCVYDCRSVIGDDLDADGKPDLIVSKNEEPYFSLFWLHNRFPTPHHWIGVRLKEERGCSPLGAQVTVLTPKGRQVAVFVVGDSYRSQHALRKHFGLGAAGRVDALEVRWANGKVQRLQAPAVDQYYLFEPPK